MDYDSIELSTRDVCEVLNVTPAMLSIWRAKGKGPEYEMLPTYAERPKQRRYRYRLGPVLDFLASRGTTKTEIKAARRKLLYRHRQRLARAADAERGHAVHAIRKARRAREAAALAGHKPSIRIYASGDF